MPLAPLTHTICQESRLLFDRRKFAAVSRLRSTESSSGSRLPTSDCINRPRLGMLRRVKANLVSIVLVTGLSLTVGLAQPSTNQPQRRFPLPPGVKPLDDVEYGKASGKAVLLALGQHSRKTPTL